MRRKIVAITSQYLKEPISQIVSELKLNCDIQVVSYNKFDTISEVYDSYAGDTDGFLISGKIAKAAIESTAHAYNRPIVSFEIDIAGLYRALLNLLISNRDLDMDRIILDFLIPIDGGCTATAFLKELDIDTVPPHINNWTKALTRTSISTIENHVLSELIRMWNNNERIWFSVSTVISCRSFVRTGSRQSIRCQVSAISGILQMNFCPRSSWSTCVPTFRLSSMYLPVVRQITHRKISSRSMSVWKISLKRI